MEIIVPATHLTVAATLQSEYERLIENVAIYPADIRDPLIKGVSATKTALDALDSKILNDKITEAVNGFLNVLVSINDVLVEIHTSPAGAVLTVENEQPTIDPVPTKRQEPRTDTESDPDTTGSDRDD